jgi:CxxC motif-containing protein (DUF1111 family)
MDMPLPLGTRRYTLACLIGVGLGACEPSSSPVASPPADGTEITPSEVASALDSASASTLGGPISGLGAAELARFTAGQTQFEEVEGITDGLGPVFNEASCATCHAGPVGGTTGRLETRFGRTVGGVFDPLVNLGGSLIQDHGIGLVHTAKGDYTFVGEVVPPEANVVARRLTVPLFGLGLVDAVPDAELLEIARLEAAFSPATHGTAAMVTEIRTGATRVGRFGWKGQNPTLFQFAGDAYLNEMGITNPEFPNETCPQGNCAALAFNPEPTLNDSGADVTAFTDFMTFLGPPPRADITLQVIRGNALFITTGCASCHTPTLVTGTNPVRALSRRVFHPYSDFLLHDMGSLGDGIAQAGASATQMRTAPLWGVRNLNLLLHDGRAMSIEAAILAHDGQGRAARDRFAGLNASAQQALLAFLNSL